MFNNHNFYIFILLFLFSVLLNMFNAFIPHDRWVDIVSWILLAVPVLAFGYLLKFQNSDVNPFYALFSSLLAIYVLVFAGTKLFALFQQAATISQ
ncbi:hypothetical protein A3C91_05100 [Candidatus Azambacteria bacterium RIFCSPHIGHO2_02_FULL_52_12]|uniref:Uncharacterized protein n=1 Tax=Candidatus Azambacteria bacterium RIFCSPLOWO2_01_FULL_46_25 TaxID=1797298 RepID=A0A1F5BVY3_9BACT|nr:MAG: hypothetical protein A3C91_05100 [Candidatus Azambacteria bacterium RIFCSPHIGHO2_02_FULL_52_12]OGD34766.1 MAG: hypothetical protein A2988_04710 [Candidatus Azambacteria bacterium RIFCSPLOWO2_01_FULL_46_25]OGD37891.1 MAG: hypothetical protein A2850_04785 [Candidatus Azambacteria bacterium RIFCSPHIGHO2_01_FULL_51_74]